MDANEITNNEPTISDEEFILKLSEMIRLGKGNMEYGNNPDFRNIVDEWVEELQNFKASRHAGSVQILFEDTENKADTEE
jgi:hypothetical protein